MFAPLDSVTEKGFEKILISIKDNNTKLNIVSGRKQAIELTKINFD